MDRKSIFDYADKTYQSIPEYLWAKDPDSAVLRHNDNKKWYALIMNISKDKLGLEEEGKVEVINMKCDPQMIDTLQMTKGIFPAYHMNKRHWISVLLDGSVDDNMVYHLLDISFKLTK